MNDNIKIRKFVFDDKNPRAIISEKERTTFLTAIKRIEISILEIEAENPSDLILVITTESPGIKKEIPFYLYNYRDKMKFQNNKYIMRLTHLLTTVNTHFNLEIVSDNKLPFKVTAYYSTRDAAKDYIA